MMGTVGKMEQSILPVTDEQVQKIRKAFLDAIAKHGIDTHEFLEAFPALRDAIQALPFLEKWKALPDEFRYCLIPQMQTNNIPLPESFLRDNQGLLDFRSGYNYGFVIERRRQPR